MVFYITQVFLNPTFVEVFVILVELIELFT